MNRLQTIRKLGPRTIGIMVALLSIFMPGFVHAIVNVHEPSCVLGSCSFHEAYNGCIANFRAAGKGGLVDQLDRSEHEFDIERTDKKDSGTDPENQVDASNGTGTGGTMRWNPNGGIVFTDGIAEDGCSTLYHEMNHLAQYDTGTRYKPPDDSGKFKNIECQGRVDGRIRDSGLPINEVLATREENSYRDSRHLPKRTKYSHVDLPPFDCELPKLPPPQPKPKKTGCSGGCSVGGAGASPISFNFGDLIRAFILGDPHLYTFNGVDYDFQAAGEFTALGSKSGDMVVQVRQIPWSDSRWVSVTSAIAVKVNGDQLTIEFSQNSLILRLNGNPATLNERQALPAGGFIMPHERGYIIGWPDGSLLRALRNVRGVDTSLYLSTERAGTVHGLLGPFNDKRGEILETKDGKTINKEKIKEYRQLYHVFGDSWRISQAESLFDYATGTSTATYQKKDFPDPNPPKLPTAKVASARDICLRAGVPERALAGCILDVAITGEVGFATTTAAAMWPPSTQATDSSNATPSFALKIGDHVAPHKPAKGAGRIETAGAIDRYTFTAVAGTLVYLKSEPPCTASAGWGVQDAAGAWVSTFNDAVNICADIGRTRLKAGGTYTIVVSGRESATGDYGFTVLPIEADQTFPTKLGDHVAPHKPAKGAGRIETAGAIDRYTFTAVAGTLVYLKSEPPCTASAGWGVQDAAGAWVSTFNDAVNICADIGRTRLKAGGTYTIVVSGRESATGDYGFTLQSLPLTASGTVACTQDRGDPSGTTGRDLNGYMWSDPAMTNTKCRNSCASRGFVFSGTQYGSYCFCGNRYGQFGPATNCDMGCSGDNTETCGGSWANSVSRSGAEPTTPKAGLKNPTSP